MSSVDTARICLISYSEYVLSFTKEGAVALTV
jgi:hypothetical protein